MWRRMWRDTGTVTGGWSGSLSNRGRGTRATLGAVGQTTLEVFATQACRRCYLLLLQQHASKWRSSRYLNNYAAHLMGWQFKKNPLRLSLCAVLGLSPRGVLILEPWSLGGCGGVEFSGPLMKS
jgi:hypothetical protein